MTYARSFPCIVLGFKTLFFAESTEAAFDLDQLANKVSSKSKFEEESSFDFLQEGEVEQALLDENEIVLNIEKD